jgi:hypothetical protein
MEAALDHIRAEYGSADAYLTADAGVDAAALDGLRELLVSP